MSTRLPGRVAREVLRRHLEELSQTAGTRGVVLYSPDGFEVASCAIDAEASARLAAIGSSLAALGTAISAEAGLRECDRTLVEGQDGTVMIMRVEGTSGLSLALIATQDAVLGRLLWASKKCCHEVANVLKNESAQASRQPAAGAK